MRRYSYSWSGLYIILASFGSHKWLEERYPAVYEHLHKYKAKLKNRGQCRYTASGKPNLKPNAPYPGQHHWLELDNNPSTDHLEDFSRQKIVWGEISDIPKFAFDDGEYMQEATTFLMTGAEPKYLLAFLNSAYSMYSFGKIGTTTGVGTLRWKKYMVEEFFIPRPTEERFAIIMPLIEQQLTGVSQEKAIDQAIHAIFGFTQEEISCISK